MDGNLVSTGGFQGGANTVRYLNRCLGCNWREYPTALSARRWYFNSLYINNNIYELIIFFHVHVMMISDWKRDLVSECPKKTQHIC